MAHGSSGTGFHALGARLLLAATVAGLAAGGCGGGGDAKGGSGTASGAGAATPTTAGGRLIGSLETVDDPNDPEQLARFVARLDREKAWRSVGDPVRRACSAAPCAPDPQARVTTTVTMEVIPGSETLRSSQGTAYPKGVVVARLMNTGEEPEARYKLVTNTKTVSTAHYVIVYPSIGPRHGEAHVVSLATGQGRRPSFVMRNVFELVPCVPPTQPVAGGGGFGGCGSGRPAPPVGSDSAAAGAGTDPSGSSTFAGTVWVACAHGRCTIGR